MSQRSVSDGNVAPRPTSVVVSAAEPVVAVEAMAAPDAIAAAVVQMNTPGDDMLTGTAGDDLIRVELGGDDNVSGGAGNDGFYFGAAYTSADVVDGGAGTLDQIGLQGNYATAVTLGSLIGVEFLVMLPGDDARFGGQTGTNLSYNLTATNASVATGGVLRVQGNTLRAGENLTFNGAAELDGSFLMFGGLGIDTLTGGSGNDGFFFGQGRFGATDVVNGGAGTMDQLAFQGNFTTTFGAAQISGIEMIVLLSAANTNFGAGGGIANYDLTTDDANVAAGGQLVVQANALRADETLNFKGFFETNGSFRIFSGAGNDTLAGSQSGGDVIFGGAGSDVIEGQGGADQLTGGSGGDSFHYLQPSHSTDDARDQILDFATGDKIDLSGLAVNTGSFGFSYIGSSAQFGSGQVQVIQSGTMATVRVFIDANSTADLVIDVTVIDGHMLTSADFVAVNDVGAGAARASFGFADADYTIAMFADAPMARTPMYVVENVL